MSGARSVSCDPARTFVTSDHHFGSWRTMPGPWRAFSEAEEEELVAKWNATVGPDDTVLYVGDFHDCGLADLIEYRKRLNGAIFLVKGNHDMLPDAVYEAVFQGVCDELALDGLGVVLRHCPGECPSGMRQIYGHLHRDGERNPLFDSRSFCACVQRSGGFPVPLSRALELMQSV